MQRKMAFIGGGNMAQAMILGLLKQGYGAENLAVSDLNAEKLAFFADLGVQVAADNLAAAQWADAVVLAVKPQVLAEVCAALSAVDFSPKTLISIAAGISTRRLHELLPTARAVVRVMPNTPALVGEGMAGLFATENTAENDRTFVQNLLAAVGKTVWVANEGQLHAVTAASGSSPAYFFLLLDAMQQALTAMHLDGDTARQLVQQSMLGAAAMAAANPTVSLSELRQNVTSKGGTTAAALAVFEQQGFAQTVQAAMQACVERSMEMEKSL